MNDPDLRLDPELVQRVTVHIQEHIQLLQNTDPNLLNILGQTPLPPSNPPPQQGGAPAPAAPPMPPGPGPDMGGAMMPTQMEQMGQQPGPLPSPAQVDPSLLPNPELQAMSLGNLRQG